MGLRNILTDQDPALHKTCRPVVAFDRKLHKLLDDMGETMREANGIGLAAPQVGILRRVVVVTRPYTAKVKAQDRYGEWFEVEGEEIIARCFCHELDHLDGIVYTEVMERFLTAEELEADE